MKDEGTTAAQVLVFELESNVQGRIPKEPLWEFEGQIYQNTKCHLKLFNHYERDGTFPLLFKYNAATLDFDWAIPCGIGAGVPEVRGLVYGSSGLYVAGDLHSGTTAFGSHSVTSSGVDPFVARFSESGVAQWAVTAGGEGAA